MTYKSDQKRERCDRLEEHLLDIEYKDLSIRHPAMEDAQKVVDLMIAFDIAEYGETDSDLGTVIDDWSDINLDQDAWLVYNPGKQLVGYAAVYHNTQRFTFDSFTHPHLAPEGLASFLLTLCEGRARELLHEPGVPTTAMTIVSQSNDTNKRIANNLGYKPERYHFGMRIHLDGPPPPPAWPVSVVLRNVVPDQDNHLVFDFIRAAFDRPGRPPLFYERWYDIMMCASNFNPELWFLAYHKEELIGVTLCFEYPLYGWVRQLGVSTAWRGKGIGSALLEHCFGVFYQRRFITVGLGVAADNPNAYQLYERVGMKRERHYAEYCKTLVT